MKTIMSILLPPVAVAMKGHGGGQIILNVILTALGWIPGIIHAFILDDKTKQGPTVVVNNIINNKN